MAISAMVPQFSWVTNLPPSKNRFSGGNDCRARRSTSGHGSTSSRVAYLRQHYTNQSLSGDATNLLLASWKQKTSQSYDSLCKKWIIWCSEWQTDPVSGPIEDVVNFLANLYTLGYQYRSLNAYRSAIASMHSPIDGVSVNQHLLVSRLLRGVFQS
uniref:Core-binding (CB) domain-containing protein n=1 Tax=Amphimedon queenslandica TaxID=400682 RepID=A0A1X7V4W8_AMPQE